MFRERLKELREEKGLTQSQLSEKLDIGRASVSNYELGVRTPDIEVLIRMAKFFDVTTDYLTGISNFRKSEEGSYFTNEDKNFMSKIYNQKDLNTTELNIIRDLNTYKETLLDLLGPNHYNLVIQLSFRKAISDLCIIYKRFNHETQKYIEDMNKYIEKDENIKSSNLKSKADILNRMYGLFDRYGIPSYNIHDILFHMVEEIFHLKSEVEYQANKVIISDLFEYIKISSNEVNTSLLDTIRQDYLNEEDI